MNENAKLLQAIQNIINQSYSSGDEYSYRGGRDWYNEQAEGNDFHKLVRARDAMKKGDYDKYADFVAAIAGESAAEAGAGEAVSSAPQASPLAPAIERAMATPVDTTRTTGSGTGGVAMTPYEMADTYAERHARQPQAEKNWYDAYPELQKNANMILDMAETDPEGATRWAKAFTTNMRTIKGAPPGYADGLMAQLLVEISKRGQRTGRRDMSEDKIWPASQETTRPTSRNPYQSQMPDTRFRNNY